jgi:uncharacterized coiled-coil protein SlyX
LLSTAGCALIACKIYPYSSRLLIQWSLVRIQPKSIAAVNILRKDIGGIMIDASFSRQRHQEDRAARGRRRLIIPLVATLVLIGGVTAWALGGSKVDAPPPNVAIAPANSGPASDELLETAKGLQVTQQQAVDQLQVVQDQLAAQKAETKKLSEQMAAVTEKLDALQQSIASIPAPTVAAPISPPKARHQ